MGAIGGMTARLLLLSCLSFRPVFSALAVIRPGLKVAWGVPRFGEKNGLVKGWNVLNWKDCPIGVRIGASH